ncbi:hypothetical protein DPMN_156567 [Dreissena polymorpha]|uniref:Uncharacterized protein n=1 Tax=Dreissena polymorpha TaxID=45954 RepID=A0A9D4FTS8_DREPO|nr:hypothetical protein DPMN_156567 [Dreissena polymorpha]
MGDFSTEVNNINQQSSDEDFDNFLDMGRICKNFQQRRMALADIFANVEAYEKERRLSSMEDFNLMEQINSGLHRRRCAVHDIYEGLTEDDVSEIFRCFNEHVSEQSKTVEDEEMNTDIMHVLRCRRDAKCDIFSGISEHEQTEMLAKCEGGDKMRLSRRGAVANIFDGVQDEEKTDFLLHYNVLLGK